jgi:prevent-host-death family protein
VRGIRAFQAKTKLGQLLDWVEAGEEVPITRRGKVVARLVPPESGFTRERAGAAVARIRARRKGVRLGGLKIKGLIDDGRK